MAPSIENWSCIGRKQEMEKLPPPACFFQTQTQPPPPYGKYPELNPSKRASKMPVHKRPSAFGCHAAHASNIGTKGIHQFHNMMWDPTIYRGKCGKPFTDTEYERCRRWRKARSDADNENLVKQRKFPRYQQKLGGIYRPKVVKTEQQEKLTLESMGIQTEKFLEELTTTELRKDMCTQMEPEFNLRTDYNLKLAPYSTGTCQAVQCDIGKVTLEKTLDPMKKSLSKKILEQSLLETAEEMELEEIRKEKRALFDTRREEIYKMKRLLNAQRQVAQDRELAMMNEKRQQLIAEEAEDRIGAALFATKTMGGVLPIAFSVLQLEKFLETSGAQDIYEKMMPYLDKELSSYYNLRTKVSRRVLDDLLQEVTNQRELQFSKTISEELGSGSTTQEPSSSRKSSIMESRRKPYSLDNYIGGSMPFVIDNYGFDYNE